MWLNQGVQDIRVFWHFIFVAMLVALAFIDLDTMFLPDVLVYPFLVIGLLGIFLPESSGWLNNILAGAGSGGVFWLITKIYPQGLGFGDVKFVAALGVFLGFPNIILAIFIASFLGSIIGVSMLLLQGKSMRQQIPFGPFLALGALIVLFWGERIFDLYWKLLMHL
jgi:leader peptidase (prepilin peptidase)/N-methyltransferase